MRANQSRDGLSSYSETSVARTRATLASVELDGTKGGTAEGDDDRGEILTGLAPGYG